MRICRNYNLGQKIETNLQDLVKYVVLFNVLRLSFREVLVVNYFYKTVHPRPSYAPLNILMCYSKKTQTSFDVCVVLNLNL